MATVLLVEDDWMHREFLLRLLQIKGYNVVLAVDGEEAMEILAQARPDAIILDMGLPGIDGYQTAALIRTKPEIRHVPIIALTAFALSDDHDRALQAGCDAFESKPVDLDALERKLQRLIAAQSA